jgi:hypothetical protein
MLLLASAALLSRASAADLPLPDPTLHPGRALDRAGLGIAAGGLGAAAFGGLLMVIPTHACDAGCFEPPATFWAGLGFISVGGLAVIAATPLQAIGSLEEGIGRRRAGFQVNTTPGWIATGATTAAVVSEVITLTTPAREYEALHLANAGMLGVAWIAGTVQRTNNAAWGDVAVVPLPGGLGLTGTF